LIKFSQARAKISREGHAMRSAKVECMSRLPRASDVQQTRVRAAQL